MNQQWGRAGEAGIWPNRRPVWTLAALLLAVASGVAVGASRYLTWTPLQRVYLSAYIRSALAGSLATRGRYRLLEVSDRVGANRRLALDDEVVSLGSSESEGAFSLTALGLAAGDRELAWDTVTWNHAALHRLLGQWIYRDRALLDLVAPAGWVTLAVFGVGLVVALPRDAARASSRRLGRRLKGPELVSVRAFNWRTRGDGLALALRPGLAGRLAGRRPSVRLSRRLEASHLLVVGDTGTGKSALIRQLLQQIDARDEAAIIYDPALEYLPQFYDRERGDVILNPLDARCPYWSPGDEVRHEAEALTLATSLFPDREHENPFFTDAPRRIFSHLLTSHPSAETLVRWFADEDELDRRVAGTPYAAMIDRRAPQQRSGVLASLNMVADALKLLPGQAPTRWSATSWAATRRGWIFLTSTPATRDRLRPLTSLWLDTLVLRLMTSGHARPRPTWFVLDELASLQRLPQLHTALTENRKSNNPIVLAFQGRSQLETRYGRDAETMLSQPATKIFLRTSEAHAAKWVADTIGDVETDRLGESRSSGGSRQRSYGLERQVEPLVMASEIAGLPDLRGFLKVGNLVVRLDLPYLHLPLREPDFLPRPLASFASESNPSVVADPAAASLRLVGPVVVARERDAAQAEAARELFR